MKLSRSLKSKYSCWFFLLTVIASLSAQEGEVIPLSLKVGMTVDAEENSFYAIFPQIKGFNSAQFYEVETNKIVARIVFVEYSHHRLTRKTINLRQFVALQNRINMQPEITEQDRLALRENLTYLETEEILSGIPVNQYVSIKHRDGARIKGTLISYNDRRLEIQTPVSPLSVPIWEMEKISYRSTIRERSSWRPYIYVLCSGIGLMLGEVWNKQTSPRIEMIWHYRFLGLVFGLLTGAEAYDSVNILLTAKEVFALTPEEMKKLK